MTQPIAAVIGAGPGIGLSVARRFAREGFRVALLCRPADPRQAFQKSLEEWGGEALVLPVELADPAALRAGLSAIGAALGFPEVLVYNASRGHHCLPSELNQQALAGDLQVNLTAALMSAQWALPVMRVRGRGTLLFTGGGLALEPKAEEASLSIGKAALRCLALSLAQELAPERIHAALISVCGFVQADAAFNAERVAEEYWKLHTQPRKEWESELILRP